MRLRRNDGRSNYFLDKYCPEQFEIIGPESAPSNPETLNLGKDYSEYIGYSQDRVPNGRTGSTFGKCPVIEMDDKKHPYYEKMDVGCKQPTTEYSFGTNIPKRRRKCKCNGNSRIKGHYWASL